MKKLIIQVITISLTLLAADDTSQAKLLTAVALKHTMKSANFNNDGTKMFGATTNSYAVLYDVKKQECQYQRLLNDVRSMHYYDDTQELLLCDQHHVNTGSYYMQVIRAGLKTGKEDVVYNALKTSFYDGFDCRASYNNAKDRVLIVEPTHIISVDMRRDAHSILLRSPCAAIERAFYINDDLLAVKVQGNVLLYYNIEKDAAKKYVDKRCTTVFRDIGDDPYREQLTSIDYNNQEILLQTNKRILKHELSGNVQYTIEKDASNIRHALLHPTQSQKIVLLQDDHKVLVKDVENKTAATIADPLHRYASYICSIYNNMVLLLSKGHQEVTLCDVEKKQSHNIYKGDSLLGKPLQAMLCAGNRVQIATDKKVLTYDISQLTT